MAIGTIFARRATITSTAWRRGAGGAAAGLLVWAAAASAQPAGDAVIEVKPGDTFSAIAAHYTGSARAWAKVYDRELSNLPDPNRIYPGQRFELVSEAGGKRYLKLVSGAHLASAARPGAPAAAPAAPAAPAPSPAPAAAAVVPSVSTELVVGVLPNIGAAALMSQYENLKNYLEKQGGQKVRIVLPASFKAFFDSTVRGDFDLAVSAPHFARVAQLDGGLVPLAMYEPRINAQFITPVDAPLASPKDVKGKAVAFANPTSLVAMYGQQWLHGMGLEAGTDYKVMGARTDMGVGRMLLSGDAVAAIMSNGEFRSLPPEESGRLKIAEIFARIPNFILLGNPRMGAERLARLKREVMGFMSDPDGAAFAKASGVTGIVEADDATLRELDPYVAPTRRAMGVVK